MMHGNANIKCGRNLRVLELSLYTNNGIVTHAACKMDLRITVVCFIHGWKPWVWPNLRKSNPATHPCLKPVIVSQN